MTKRGGYAVPFYHIDSLVGRTQIWDRDGEGLTHCDSFDELVKTWFEK